MSELSQKIRDLPCPSCGETVFEAAAYRRGHRDARHAAEELVLAADAELASVREDAERWRAALNRVTSIRDAGHQWEFVISIQRSEDEVILGSRKVRFAAAIDAARKGESDA